MNKALFTLLAIVGLSGSLMGQRPVIASIDKVSAGTDQIVSINGSGFGTDQTKLAVFFGATKGIITSVTDQLIEVRVPAGATFENISVTNLTTGLSAYTKQNFLQSFGGDFGFDENNLGPQMDFSANAGLYSLCMCDFDGDNKNDIVTTNDNGNVTQTTISIHRNTSTGAGNINFITSAFALGARSLHTSCGDLNGDGKPDLVVTEGGTQGKVFIMQNNSAGSISFLPPQIITQPASRRMRGIKIADLDLDGRPELIVSDQVSTEVLVFMNESAGVISFNPAPFKILFNGPPGSTDALAVEDLNGDDLPEIFVTPFLSSGDVQYVENKSTVGSLTFGPVQKINLPAAVDVYTMTRFADLDGDRKADFIGSQLRTPLDINVIPNTSNGSTISFGAVKKLATTADPLGFELGDLDGDSKPDIVVAMRNAKVLTIFNNISSPGALNFQSHEKPTTYITRYIAIGDLDGDSKPDIAFTSVDDVVNNIPASKLSVFRNRKCVTPTLTPEGPVVMCTGKTLTLKASVSSGVSYDWYRNGAFYQNTGNTASLDLTNVDGEFSVRANSEGGSCTIESNKVNVSFSGNASMGVTINPVGPLCAGGTGSITILNEIPETPISFHWTGPNGYISNTATAPLTNFQAADAGRYELEVTVGGCVYQKKSVVVSVVDTNFPLSYSGGTVICQGDTKLLSVPNVANFTYQWFKDGSAIGGATSNSYTANATGTYKVGVTYTAGSCPQPAPEEVKLTVVTPPVAKFTSNPPPGDVCSNSKIVFENQSTFDTAGDVVFNWNFIEGGATSTDKNPTHIFTTDVGTFNVELKVSYTGNPTCVGTTTNQYKTKSATKPDIVNPLNNYKFCEGDSLELKAQGGPFTSFLWSTGETTQSIYLKKEGISVDGTVSVDVEGSEGCTTTDVQGILTDPAPAVLVLATPGEITEGESSQLEASGLADYTWTPEESLSDPAIPNPLASPLVTTTYFVQGSAAGFGCPGVGSVQVIVKGEPVVNKLVPSKFFSPNQDDRNPVWTVQKIEEFPQCAVTIYDDKGVKVFEAKPYQNNWDGTFNGRKLPDGVYYYIIRCDGEENKPRTGSITVLR